LPICIEIFLFFDSSSHPCVVKPTSLITYIRYECSKNVSLRTHIRYSVGKLTSLMITHIRDARWLHRSVVTLVRDHHMWWLSS